MPRWLTGNPMALLPGGTWSELRDFSRVRTAAVVRAEALDLAARGAWWNLNTFDLEVARLKR
jgi:hypothetical protein